MTRITLATVRKQIVLYRSYADTVRALNIRYTGSGEWDERWHYSGGKCNKELNMGGRRRCNDMRGQ